MHQNWGHSQTTKSAGFTLAELAIVLVITGILMGTFMPLVPIWVNHRKTDITKEHIQEIRSALAHYYLRTGTYPCPAPRLKLDDAYSFDKDCSLQDREKTGEAAKRGVYVTDDHSIIEGGVPFRLINVPKEDAFDGWGNLITYAVGTILTNRDSFSPNGQIAINDGNGRSIIDPPGSALWVLVSHGSDGSGAYNGNAAADCNTAHLDGKNCAHNGVFVASDITRGDGKNYYDDIVFYMTWVETPPNPYPVNCQLALKDQQPRLLPEGTFVKVGERWLVCRKGLLAPAAIDTNFPIEWDMGILE